MTCRQDTATEGPGRPLTRSGSILHDPQKFPEILDGMSTNYIMNNYKYRETCKLTLKGIKHLPIVDVYRKWVMFFPSYTMLVKNGG